MELAGAKKGTDGERLGRARRDADALRAAELTLTVSGHKVERTASLHLHVFEEMSDPELEAYAERGTWPERYASLRPHAPGGPTALPAPSTTTVGASPGRPGAGPARGGVGQGIEPQRESGRYRGG